MQEHKNAENKIIEKTLKKHDKKFQDTKISSATFRFMKFWHTVLRIRLHFPAGKFSFTILCHFRNLFSLDVFTKTPHLIHLKYYWYIEYYRNVWSQYFHKALQALFLPQLPKIPYLIIECGTLHLMRSTYRYLVSGFTVFYYISCYWSLSQRCCSKI